MAHYCEQIRPLAEECAHEGWWDERFGAYVDVCGIRAWEKWNGKWVCAGCAAYSYGQSDRLKR